jgi:hypothetical protein
VKYSFNSHGALVVESKDEMRRRLGHSPDLADALCVSLGTQIGQLPAVDLSRAFGLTKPSPFAHTSQDPARRSRFRDIPQAGDAGADWVARRWGVANPSNDEDY